MVLLFFMAQGLLKKVDFVKNGILEKFNHFLQEKRIFLMSYWQNDAEVEKGRLL